MNNTLIKLILLASLVAITFLVLQPNEKKEHTQQEMENISKAFAAKFSEKQKTAAPKTKKPTSKMATEPTKTSSDIQQSIIGVIYKQPTTTWFIKAKDTKDKIETISASFKNYFVDQFKFNTNHQPDFSHIPDSMKTVNKSNMRFATFMIGDVEISVSQLAGQQDVFANVKRWMKQIGLDDNSPVHLDFKDDKKTIIVRMPR